MNFLALSSRTATNLSAVSRTSVRKALHYRKIDAAKYSRNGFKVLEKSSSSSYGASKSVFRQLASPIISPSFQQRRYFGSEETEGTKGSSQSTAVVVNDEVSWMVKLLTVMVPIGFAYFLQMKVEADEEKTDKSEFDQEKLRQVLRRTNSAKSLENLEKGKAPVYRIVLTGGPCGGKSTALSLLSDRFRSLGFRVFVVPEAATIVITGGGIWKDYRDMTPDQALAFEGNLMKTKMALEDAFFAIAEASGEPSVIICDRGTMDTAAYLPKASWEVLLDEYGWNLMTLRDRRYDGVIHLVTAAIGAEKYYTTENNTARTETLEEARALDFKILNAWVGHPVIRIIDNSTDFQDKVKRVMTQVSQIVGAPKPVNFKRKFVISNPDVNIPLKYEQFEVEQTYLLKAKGENPNGFTFIRRRGQNGSYHYSYSMLSDVKEESETEKTVLERQISGREYIALLKQADPNRITVRKRVKCFIYNNQYFQLSTFVEPSIPLTILETEAALKNDTVVLPDWLKAEFEVTDDLRYSSFKIAKPKNLKNLAAQKKKND